MNDDMAVEPTENDEETLRERIERILPYLPNYDLRDRNNPDIVLNIEQAIIVHPLRGVIPDSLLRKSIRVSRRMLPPDDDEPPEENEGDPGEQGTS